MQHRGFETNWTKLWVESTLLVSFSYISTFCPTKPCPSSVQYASACDSTEAFRALSRERLPQICDTATVRPAPFFFRKLPNSGLANVNKRFCTNITCFHLVYNELTQLLSSCFKKPILSADEHNTEMWGPVIIIIVTEHIQWTNLEACVNAYWVYSVQSMSKM